MAEKYIPELQDKFELIKVSFDKANEVMTNAYKMVEAISDGKRVARYTRAQYIKRRYEDKSLPEPSSPDPDEERANRSENNEYAKIASARESLAKVLRNCADKLEKRESL